MEIPPGLRTPKMDPAGIPEDNPRDGQMVLIGAHRYR